MSPEAFLSSVVGWGLAGAQNGQNGWLEWRCTASAPHTCKGWFFLLALPCKALHLLDPGVPHALTEGVRLDKPETLQAVASLTSLTRALTMLFQLGVGLSVTCVLGFKEDKTEPKVVLAIQTRD